MGVQNMLKRFTVQNYKSFDRPITLDFTEKHDYKFNKSCVKNGLLSKIVIYGANASGKSNLGYALFDIVGVLTDKHIESKQLDSGSFLNADSDCSEATFTYEFKKGSSTVVYEYRKSAPTVITYEQLLIDGDLIFSYNFLTKEKDFSRLSAIGADQLNFDYFENNFAILRYIAYNTLQPSDSYIRFVMSFVSHMLWFRALQRNGYIGLTTETVFLDQWIANNKLEKDFQRFLMTLAGLDRVIISKQVDPTNSVLLEQHKNAKFRFDAISSSGTLALELLFYWSRQFNDVSFLFMDEFDAFYHFDLARNVLKYIFELDNVQAAFTTHNSFLASNDLLRPDCYFVLKDGILTSFADSTDREIREGHNLEKLLRNGEFDG